MIWRVAFYVFVFLAIGYSEKLNSGQDSVLSKIDTINKRLIIVQSRTDSIENVLKEERLSAQYTKQAMEHIIATDEKVMDNLYAFMAWMGGIFAASLVGFGFFIWKRSSDEREFIARSVKDSLEPILRKNFEEVDGKATVLRTDLNNHITKYLDFNGEINRKVDRIDTIDKRLSLLPEIQNHALWSYTNYWIRSAWDRHKEGDVDEAIDNAAFAIQSCEKAEGVDSYEIMTKSATRGLLHFIQKASVIQARTKNRIIRVLPMIVEEHHAEINEWLKKVSVVETPPTQDELDTE